MSLPSFDAIAKAAEASALNAHTPRFVKVPEDAFPAASLLGWLTLAQEANVKYVPAHVEATVLIEPLLRFDENLPESDPEFAKLADANAGLGEREMLRWDCCAPEGVKQAMHVGQAPQSKALRLMVDDPRAYDLLYEFPEDAIAILKRPWVTAQVHETHPVEFRVFIQDGRCVAVANYYPQRDLPDTPQMREWALRSVWAAQAIVQRIHEGGKTPWASMPRNIPEVVQRAIHGTLDFLVDAQGQVLLLEGGPGFGFGAHPCTFYDPDTGEVSALEGIKLGIKTPALPL